MENGECMMEDNMEYLEVSNEEESLLIYPYNVVLVIHRKKQNLLEKFLFFNKGVAGYHLS